MWRQRMKEKKVKGSVWKGKNVKELKCRKGNECEGKRMNVKGSAGKGWK